MFTLLLLLLTTQVIALWPIPHSFQSGSSFVKLDPSFNVNLDCPNPPDDLHDAIRRTMDHLKHDNLERLAVGRGAADHDSLANAPSLSTLTLSLSASKVNSIFDEATKPLGTRNEGYTLSIPGTGGTATITANSSLGLFRGLTTFEQLFYFDGENTTYTYQAPVQISDTPAYVRIFSFPKFQIQHFDSLTEDSCSILLATCKSYPPKSICRSSLFPVSLSMTSKEL